MRALVLCAIAAAAVAKERKVGGVEIRLELPRREFLAGENLELQVTVRNTGPSALTLPNPFHSVNWQPTYTVRGPGHPAGKTFSFRSATMRAASAVGDEKDAVLIDLAPGQAEESGVPLHQWVDLVIPGKYTVSARLQWKGVDVTSNEVELEIEQPVPVAMRLVHDQDSQRALWIHRGRGAALLVEQHFARNEAMPGVLRTHLLGRVADATPDATSPFSPPVRVSGPEMLNFWRGYRTDTEVVGLSRGAPVRHPLPEGAQIVQEPFLVPTGELDLLTARGRSLTMTRLSPGGAPAPRELWTVTLEEPPVELAATERIDRKGGRRLAFTAGSKGGLHLALIDLASPNPGAPQAVRAGDARPLKGALPALRIEADGSVRAAVVYQRTARKPGASPAEILTLLEARFGPDGAPAGAPVLTDLGEPAAPAVAAAAAFREAGETVWAVLLATGELWHAGAPRPQRLPGAVVPPLQLLVRGANAYVLAQPPNGPPALISLR